MRFTSTKEVLLKGIQGVQTVIDPKAVQPILSHILIESKNDNIVLTATDFNIGIVSILPIKPIMTGAITIPAKKILEIVKELPDNETISVSVKKNNLVSIECGKSLFKIMGLPEEEFSKPPEFKDKNNITLKQNKLKTMLRRTSFAIGHDEIRHVLNGILFVIKPTYLRLAATDGRCLAVTEDKIQLPKTAETKFILPAKAVDELDRMLADSEEEIKLFLAEKQVSFDKGSKKLISRLIEGEFPNYEKVIPEEAKEKIVVARAPLLAAIKRTALFTSHDSMFVKIDVSRDKITLSKNDPHMGEARVELEAQYKGKDISIGFNPDYLINLLKNIDEENIYMELVDPAKPGVVRIGDEYVYVVMPRQPS
ncbi:MAG: DNA polymerase III subunit beta [Candidatus Omnitrophica bacterium]|nr:DNA polymerase III subunit beta [Candidatus Omnitrophota bacterium]MCM8791394.1 DNA polymerase III subunit beta [Candidatus Omnitrophota bacterium]